MFVGRSGDQRKPLEPYKHSKDKRAWSVKRARAPKNNFQIVPKGSLLHGSDSEAHAMGLQGDCKIYF